MNDVFLLQLAVVAITGGALGTVWALWWGSTSREVVAWLWMVFLLAILPLQIIRVHVSGSFHELLVVSSIWMTLTLASYLGVRAADYYLYRGEK